MTYCIADLTEAIVDTGWDTIYGHTDGWHSLCEHLFWTSQTVSLPGIGTLTEVENHGGGEGSGRERWFVFKVTDAEGGERTFRVNGFYESYCGSEFEDVEEVAPAEKTIQVWDPVK